MRQCVNGNNKEYGKTTGTFKAANPRKQGSKPKETRQQTQGNKAAKKGVATVTDEGLRIWRC